MSFFWKKKPKFGTVSFNRKVDQLHQEQELRDFQRHLKEILPETQKQFVAFTYDEIVKLVPSLEALKNEPINTTTVAKIFTTLANSTVVPSLPIPQVPHKFETIFALPFTDAKLRQHSVFILFSRQ